MSSSHTTKEHLRRCTTQELAAYNEAAPATASASADHAFVAAASAYKASATHFVAAASAHADAGVAAATAHADAASNTGGRRVRRGRGRDMVDRALTGDTAPLFQ